MLIGNCENCGEKLWITYKGEAEHLEPYDSEFPKQCNPNKVKK